MMLPNFPTRIDREQRLNSSSSRYLLKGCTIWLTGLSASGKTTVAFALEKYLVCNGLLAYCFDADDIRRGLNNNLEFSRTSSFENVRRVSEVSKLFADAGGLSIVSFISPHQESRHEAFKIHRDAGLPFIEVYMNTPLSMCESRDPKGLYKKARHGQLNNMVGIQIPYESPIEPDITIDTSIMSIDKAIQQILYKLVEKKIISPEVGFVVRELFTGTVNPTILSAYVPVDIDKDQLGLVQMLSEGWATPSSGFTREDGYLEYIHLGCYINDSRKLSCLPTMLTCSIEYETKIHRDSNVVLRYQGHPIATLKNCNVFHSCFGKLCVHHWKDMKKSDPHLNMVFKHTQCFIGGDLEVFERIRFHDGLDHLRFTPNELKQLFYDLKGDTVVSIEIEGLLNEKYFLLMSRIREYLICLGFKNPLIFIHPSGSNEEFPLSLLIEQYEVYINLLKDSKWSHLIIILSLLPLSIMIGELIYSERYLKALRLIGVDLCLIFDKKSDSVSLSDIQIINENLITKQFGTAACDISTRNMRLSYLKLFEDIDFVSSMKMKQLLKRNEFSEAVMPLVCWRVLLKYHHESLKS